MAKVKVLNLKKVQTKLRKEIVKSLRDPSIREGIGEIYVDAVQDKKTPVKSKATKKWREYLEKGNTTSSKYSKANINLTFTGELMEDLKKNVKVKTTAKIAEYKIAQSDKLHKRYKNPKGKGIGKRQKYSAISGYLLKKGYDYLDSSYLKDNDKVTEKMIKFIKNGILSRLKKLK